LGYYQSHAFPVYNSARSAPRQWYWSCHAILDDTGDDSGDLRRIPGGDAQTGWKSSGPKEKPAPETRSGWKPGTPGGERESGIVNKAQRRPPPQRKAHDREYHIVPEGDGWYVERDDTVTGLFAYDVDDAISLAVPVAQRDLHNGLDVIVCVQERDGRCRKV
jgi:hypothetical protein